MGPGRGSPSLWPTRDVTGPGTRYDIEGDMEGAAWICEAPTVFGVRGRWAALGIVELLFDGTPATCLGCLCVDSGEDSVTGISVLSNDVVDSDGRPGFRNLLASGNCTELESDSWVKPVRPFDGTLRGVLWVTFDVLGITTWELVWPSCVSRHTHSLQSLPDGSHVLLLLLSAFAALPKSVARSITHGSLVSLNARLAPA